MQQLDTKYENMEFKDWTITVLFVIIGLAAGLMSAYQYYDSTKSANEAKQLSIQLRDAQSELNSSQKTANDKANKLILANEKLVEAQEKINVLQNETIKKLGGDGFASIEIRRTADKVFFFGQCSDKYPLYNCILEIRDYNEIKKCKTTTKNGIVYMEQECYNKNLKQFPSVTLNPGILNQIQGYSCQISELPKYLKFSLGTNNISTVQFSILVYNKQKNDVLHYFRIAEVNKEGKVFKIIYSNCDSSMDKEFKENFDYLKEILLF